MNHLGVSEVGLYLWFRVRVIHFDRGAGALVASKCPRSSFLDLSAAGTRPIVLSDGEGSASVVKTQAVVKPVASGWLPQFRGDQR